MLPVALALVFFPRQIARGAVLFNRFILRRDISEAQKSLERRASVAGWVALALYALYLCYELALMLRNN